MSYAIIRNAKYKKENLMAVYRHNERKRPVPGLAGPDRTLCAQEGIRASCIAAHERQRFKSDGVGNGQLGAATGAAAGKNLAAILGGHTGTEAVHLRALTLLGLIRSDRRCHNYTLLIFACSFEQSMVVPKQHVVPCISEYSILHPRRTSQDKFIKNLISRAARRRLGKLRYF